MQAVNLPPCNLPSCREVKAADSSIWNAAAQSLAQEVFPASKLFVFRDTFVSDEKNPAHVGLLNCELVKVPVDYKFELETLPQRIERLGAGDLLNPSPVIEIATADDLVKFTRNRDHTALVHHVCVPALGYSYPERLISKTYAAFKNADMKEWKKLSTDLCGFLIVMGAMNSYFNGNLQALEACAGISVMGSLALLAIAQVTLSSVYGSLRRIALPPYPPSLH